MKTYPAALLFALTLAFVLAPSLTPPFTGYGPDQFPVTVTRHPIQPAGYAFAIWGLIYAWLILHAGFGLFRRNGTGSADLIWQRTRLPLIGAVALGTVWLAIAGSWPLLATATIAVMAALAITAFLRAAAGQDRWLLIAPLGLFAGWLTAATLASVGILLGGYGVLSPVGAAWAMLAVALGLGLALQARQGSMPSYGLTVTWALVAIAVVNRADQGALALGAAVAAGVMAAGTGLLFARSRT